MEPTFTSTLFEAVVNDNTTQVESMLARDTQNSGYDQGWRSIIPQEMGLVGLMTTVLKDKDFVPKLLSYEISAISSLHMAALQGSFDILVVLLDKNVPVDIELSCGTTALHLAAFGGHLNCVQFLLEVHKAEVNKQDKYGWTALHYASTEGRLTVVKELCAHGADATLRDKDGTTAAFRAINHKDVAEYLVQQGANDDTVDLDIAGQEANKSNRCQNQLNSPQDQPPGGAGNVPKPIPKSVSSLQKRQSLPVSSQRPECAVRRSNTLPSQGRERSDSASERIRALIRNELDEAFDPDPYETPVDSPKEKVNVSLTDDGVGMCTLKGIMREELARYRNQYAPVGSSVVHSIPTLTKEEEEEEDIYATLEPAPAPPVQKVTPPALPPRNMQTPLKPTEQSPQTSPPQTVDVLKLQRQSSFNDALGVSISLVAPLVGTKWKKLAHALPLESDRTLVDQRIDAIECYPGKPEQKAASVLAEWHSNNGKDATVDKLIAALRKCGLQRAIGDIERLTQEFNA